MCSRLCFFFFKQKTAYEMRISDWSSDVCSSDLDDAIDKTQGAEHGDRNSTCFADASAYGALNNASGAQSSAFGYNNIARGTPGSAFGWGNKARGNNATNAYGWGNTVDGDSNSALGCSNTVKRSEERADRKEGDR